MKRSQQGSSGSGGFIVILVCLCTCISSMECRAQFRSEDPSGARMSPGSTVLAGAGNPIPASDSIAAVQAAGSRSVWTRLIALGSAAVLYSGFDYFGYNLTRHDPAQLIGYRMLQLAAQAGITWLLCHFIDLPTAVAFNTVWWTFGLDIMYYGYAEILNPGDGWESRGDFRRGVMNNHATWAYWTPVGLLRGAHKDKVIAGDTLVAQALLGAAVGVTLTICW